MVENVVDDAENEIDQGELFVCGFKIDFLFLKIHSDEDVVHDEPPPNVPLLTIHQLLYDARFVDFCASSAIQLVDRQRAQGKVPAADTIRTQVYSLRNRIASL